MIYSHRQETATNPTAYPNSVPDVFKEDSINGQATALSLTTGEKNSLWRYVSLRVSGILVLDFLCSTNLQRSPSVIHIFNVDLSFVASSKLVVQDAFTLEQFLFAFSEQIVRAVDIETRLIVTSFSNLLEVTKWDAESPFSKIGPRKSIINVQEDSEELVAHFLLILIDTFTELLSVGQSNRRTVYGPLHPRCQAWVLDIA